MTAADTVLWHALSGSVVTSVVPALLLIVLPRAPSPAVSRVLMALAAGALLGDVLLHMMPHLAASPHADHGHDHHGHGHDHDHDHGHHHDHHSHDHHDHSHGNQAALLMTLAGVALFFVLDVLFARLGASVGASHGHSHGERRTAGKRGSALDEKRRDDEATERRTGATAALLLLADATHNAVDGVVLAASFLRSAVAGWRTVLVVLVHEVPHELGDYAVLKRCGYSAARIVAAQVATGLASLAGCAAVTVAGEHATDFARDVLTPLAAGSFLYMAFSTFLAEARAGLESKGAVEVVATLLGFCAGVAMLLVTSAVEEALGVHAH